MEMKMKKPKKPPALGWQIAGLSVLALYVAAYVAGNLKYNFFSWSAHVWFTCLFAEPLVLCWRQYVKTPTARMQLKIAAILLASYVTLAPVSLILPAGSDWQPYTFETERAAIEAARTVPDAHNAALFYQPLFEKLGSKPEFPESVKNHLKDLLQRPWDSETHTEAAAWLQAQSDMIDALVGASRVPECRFPVTESYWDLPDRHAQLRFCSRVLTLSANADLYNGDTDASLCKCLAAMQIASHSAQQPSIADLLSGITIEGMTFVPLRNLIVDAGLSAQQLDMIARQITIEEQWREVWLHILAGEKLQLKNIFGRAYQINSQGRIRFTHDFFGQFAAEGRSEANEIRKNGLDAIIMTALAPKDPGVIARTIDNMYAPLQQEDFDWARMSDYEQYRASQYRRLPGVRIFVLFVPLDAEWIWRVRGFYLGMLAERRGMRLLVDLRRYHIRNSHWPEDLTQIAEDVPSDALIDPTNDGEFVYVRAGDGFRLYSKGQNGIDEGGRQDRKTGADDILIWPLRDDSPAEPDAMPNGEVDG
jgi:hypothetical protein